MAQKRKSRRDRVSEPVLAPGARVGAAEFKARCLDLMDQVRERHVDIIITKHGKPVAKLVPVEEPKGDIWGYMKGTFEIVGDIISPVVDPDEFSYDEENL